MCDSDGSFSPDGFEKWLQERFSLHTADWDDLLDLDSVPDISNIPTTELLSLLDEQDLPGQQSAARSCDDGNRCDSPIQPDRLLSPEVLHAGAEQRHLVAWHDAELSTSGRSAAAEPHSLPHGSQSMQQYTDGHACAVPSYISPFNLPLSAAIKAATAGDGPQGSAEAHWATGQAASLPAQQAGQQHGGWMPAATTVPPAPPGQPAMQAAIHFAATPAANAAAGPSVGIEQQTWSTSDAQRRALKRYRQRRKEQVRPQTDAANSSHTLQQRTMG